jgi:hypothetical protein
VFAADAWDSVHRDQCNLVCPEPHFQRPSNGFALLSADAALPEREHTYLRPGDLREAALHYLGRPTQRRFEGGRRTVATETDTLRIMTYNVHSCKGMDGKLDTHRIARLIARAQPDVVALQELDAGRVRSHGMDQAQLIARHLRMADVLGRPLHVGSRLLSRHHPRR